jgi:hypothetical protein
MVLDLLKIGLLEKPTEESTKTEELDNKEKSTKILYNKKLLLIVGIVILAIIIYIYYFDVSITLPIISSLPSYNLFNKKKKNKNNTKNKDEFEEFSSDDESEIIDSWNLELEIKNYMEKQHEYISNNLT